jgi:hypothetical protein
MQTQSRWVRIALVLGLAGGAGGCSMGSASGDLAIPTGSGPSSSPSSGTSTETSQGTDGGAQVQAGQLTAGTWDDNLNFDFYLDYLASMTGPSWPGLPIIQRTSRLTIHVTDGAGAPVAGARVTVTAGSGGTLLDAPVRSDGRLFFFPGVTNTDDSQPLQITATSGGASATTSAHAGDGTVEVQLSTATAARPTALDLALVIDTTGSMGDEIAYLKAEVDDIATRVSQSFPGVAQRWALVLYRDDGVEYVVRSFDFTSSLADFKSKLNAQEAGGGGDFPESPDKGLAQMNTLSWTGIPGQQSQSQTTQANAARVAFWIADAPHHVGREAAMVADTLAAQRLGIHIYPISASGTDDLLEYTMRTVAEVTGGRYLFLTNDSGIGNVHKQPRIPCYVVTTLNKAMFRMIGLELTGDDVQPDPADILRTAGDPHNGRCTLTDGQQVQAL